MRTRSNASRTWHGGSDKPDTADLTRQPVTRTPADLSTAITTVLVAPLIVSVPGAVVFVSGAQR